MNSCSRFVFSLYCNQLIIGKNRGWSQTCHLQKGNTCKSLCLLLKRKPLKTFSHRAGFAIMSASDPPVYKQVRTSWTSCILCSSNLPDRKRKTKKKIPFDIASIGTFLCFSSSYTDTLVVRETWRGCPCLHETGPTRMSQRTKSVEREGCSFVFVKYQHRNLLVSRKKVSLYDCLS